MVQKSWIGFCLLYLFSSWTLLAQDRDVANSMLENDPLNVKKAVLDNGFEVYLIEDEHAPMIFGAVAVKAGGKYDPKDATGMGHYLEHMLFKGTTTLGTTDYTKEKVYLDKIDALYEDLGKTTEPEKRKAIQKKINEEAVAAAEYAIPNELDRLLASIGSKGVNAFTTAEMIVYHNSFPSNQVEKWLDIYAHRFQNPVFRLFQSELETVYEEKNRAMDDFTRPLFERFQKSLFKNHPYGQQSVLGETDHLKNPSLMKMYAYFNKYYVANNMALVLSGDFDAEEVMPVIKAKF
ncbi:MAG: insulinase family protein, partial [Bacteroidota bacterium]